MRKVAFAPTLVLATVLGSAALLTGCSNSGGGPAFSVGTGTTAGTQSSATASSHASGTPQADGSLPSADKLRAALLTASEVGQGFTEEPDSDQSDTISGCPDLAPLLENGYVQHSTQREVQVLLASGTDEVATGEILVAEPTGTANTDYARLTQAAQDCKSFQDSSDGSTTTVQLSSISFGPGTLALRADGPVEGSTFTEYIAVTKVAPNVLLSFEFGSGDSGSSQAAYALFQQAVAKATSQLGSA